MEVLLFIAKAFAGCAVALVFLVGAFILGALLVEALRQLRQWIRFRWFLHLMRKERLGL